MIRIKKSLLKARELTRSFCQFSPCRKAFLFASLGLLLVVASAFCTVSGPLVLTPADAGKTVTIFSGKQVIIQLPDNSGSTGYTWNFTTSRNQALTLQSTTYLPPSSQPMPGAPGTIVFTFLAHNSGSVQLHFELRRSWEGDVPPAQRFTVTIQVQQYYMSHPEFFHATLDGLRRLLP